MILLYITSFHLTVKCNQNDEKVSFSYITLKTNVIGYVQIISEDFSFLPNETRINDYIYPEIKKGYYFNTSESIIKLVWYYDIYSTNSMFHKCYNLTEIDLSNFNSRNVEDTDHMFNGCSSLTSINLSSFDTSNVLSMEKMFYGCSSLISLDLSSFNISKVLILHSIFSGCSSLVSFDLSYFNPENLQYMNLMFYNCSNLEYINLYEANLNEQDFITSILKYSSKNVTICSNREDLENLFSVKQDINCYNKHNDIISNENDLKCYMNNSVHVNNKYICRICGNNYFMKYNISNNLNNSDIICYESPKGYYLDENDWAYKLCYNSCKTCIMNGNETQHNCIECNDDYKYEINLSNFKNCYNDNPYNIITDTILNSIAHTIIITYSDEKIHIKNRTKLIKTNIETIFNELNLTEINNGMDKKIIEKDLVIILTSTLNQRINEDQNNFSMNLGECENILKKNYNISNNDSLYILQIISEEIGMKIPKIEYEVYYPLYNTNNLTKLNLTCCKDTKIEVSIAVKINDTLDKYNSSSNYYNDICSKTTSESGTDISLKDRRNEFVDNNMSLCEENCDLIGYNKTTTKAKCSCDTKLNIPENYDIKFNKKDFFKNFIDVNNFMNINIMKCYKTVLKIKSLIKNYGFFFIFFIVFFYFITVFIFCLSSYIKLKKDINKIFLSLKNNETLKIDKTIQKPIKKLKKKKKRKKKVDSKEIKNEINNENNPIDLQNKKVDNKKIDYSKQITQNIEDKSNNKINKINMKDFGLIHYDNVKNKYSNGLIEQKDFEINALDYDEAILLDKRNFCEYYTSLIKNNHPLVFSFGLYQDYNSKILKMFLFFFSFSLDLTVNALFFSDDTMHKIYEDKGKFNFLYQIPQILYSTLISKFIDGFIRKLALSQDNIVELKQEKDKAKLNKKYIRTKRILKKKFIAFFLISFINLMFFWYYLICFCGIYVNTQMHLIKDSGFSLLTGLFIPFAMCLIPGIFRISSLRVEKPTRGFLYKFAAFIENYLC